MNATTSIPDSSAPDSSAGTTVSWQTIFWTLVPLAVNAMAQPGGRVCGLPSRYRTYLRCSPFLCVADAVSITARLLVSTIYQGQSFLEAVGTLFHERFRDDDQIEDPPSPSSDREASALELDDGQDEIMQSLEKMTWIRWLWFILGTLPPAVKLMSMKGVPWVQAWGMMFLFSWVLNEGLVIVAAMNRSFFTTSPSGRISWPGFEQAMLSPQYRQFQLVMSRLDTFLSGGSLIVHVVIMNGVFRTLWRTSIGDAYPLSATLAVTGPGYTTIISTFMLTGLGLMVHLLPSLFSPILNAIIYALPLFTFFLMLTCLGTNTILAAIIERQYKVSLSALYVFLVSTFASSAILRMLKLLGLRFVLLGQNLLLIQRSSYDRELHIDQGACLSFVFFLNTVLACLLWYGYIYDPSDTFNPGWTGVFG